MSYPSLLPAPVTEPEPLPSRELPPIQQPVPVSPILNPQQGGSGFDRFKEIMRIVAPVLAASAAFRQHQLGTFAGAYQEGSELQRRARAEEDAQKMRGAEYNLQATRLAQEIHDSIQRRADMEMAAKAAQEVKQRGLIVSALQPFEENPLYKDGIPASVADSSVIDVPGVGRISLKDALTRAGVAEQDGKYLYGKPYKAPATPRTPLVTTPGPNGKPIRTEDKPGTPVYERPRQGPAPKEPKKPSISVKRDLIEGQIVTYTNPDKGMTQEYTREEIRNLLKGQDRASDDATLDKVLRSPEALGELLSNK